MKHKLLKTLFPSVVATSLVGPSTILTGCSQINFRIKENTKTINKTQNYVSFNFISSKPEKDIKYKNILAMLKFDGGAFSQYVANWNYTDLFLQFVDDRIADLPLGPKAVSIELSIFDENDKIFFSHFYGATIVVQ